MQRDSRMHLLIADELKNKGSVIYNPFNYGTKPGRYVIPLPLEFSTPIDEMSVEDYLIYCEERKKETLEYIAKLSSAISNDSIYFEIFAEDSFFCWTADIYFDDFQEATKFAWIFEEDEIYDSLEQEIIYLDEID